jgi:hypothetical protein
MPRRSDRLFLLALGVVAVALGAQVLAAPTPLPSRAGMGGEVRDVDVERIRQLIEEARLSDHEAEHYRALDGGEEE